MTCQNCHFQSSRGMTTLDDLDELLGGDPGKKNDNWRRLVLADEYDPLDLDTLGGEKEHFDPDAFTFNGNDHTEDIDVRLDSC